MQFILCKMYFGDVCLGTCTCLDHGHISNVLTSIKSLWWSFFSEMFMREFLINYVSRLGWCLISFQIYIIYVFGSIWLRIDMGGITIEWDYVAIELEDNIFKGFRNLWCY
jgi:hypothetical protein